VTTFSVTRKCVDQSRVEAERMLNEYTGIAAAIPPHLYTLVTELLGLAYIRGATTAVVLAIAEIDKGAQ
jgi:hypothetical protein